MNSPTAALKARLASLSLLILSAASPSDDWLRRESSLLLPNLPSPSLPMLLWRLPDFSFLGTRPLDISPSDPGKAVSWNPDELSGDSGVHGAAFDNNVNQDFWHMFGLSLRNTQYLSALERHRRGLNLKIILPDLSFQFYHFITNEVKENLDLITWLKTAVSMCVVLQHVSQNFF